MSNTATVHFRGDATQLTKTLGGVKKSAQGVKDKFGPAATAASGMASALGGMSGQGGAALGAIDNLANALMTGGPLAAGMAIATTVLVGMVSHFSKLIEESNKAKKALKDAADSAAKAFAASIDAMMEMQTGAARLRLEQAEDSKRIASEHADLLTTRIKKEESAIRETSKLMRGKQKTEVDLLIKIQEQHEKNLKALVDERQTYNDTYNAEVTDVERLNAQLEKENTTKKKLATSTEKSGKTTKKISKETADILKKENAAIDDYFAKRKQGEQMLDDLLLKASKRVDVGTAMGIDLPSKKVEVDELEHYMYEANKRDAEQRKALDKQVFESRKAEALGYAQESAAMMSGAIFQEAALRAQIADAQKAGDTQRINDLQKSEQDLQRQILVAVMSRLAQEAISRGTILAVEGAAMMIANPAAGGAELAGGLALIGLGMGGMAGAGYVSGMGGAASSTTSAAAQTTTSPTTVQTSAGAAPVQQQRTIVYNIYGNAFGMGEDDSARGVARLNAQGQDLGGVSGWTP